jgi:hypothetical protein
MSRISLAPITKLPGAALRDCRPPQSIGVGDPFAALMQEVAMEDGIATNPVEGVPGESIPEEPADTANEDAASPDMASELAAALIPILNITPLPVSIPVVSDIGAQPSAATAENPELAPAPPLLVTAASVLIADTTLPVPDVAIKGSPIENGIPAVLRFAQRADDGPAVEIPFAPERLDAPEPPTLKPNGQIPHQISMSSTHATHAQASPQSVRGGEPPAFWEADATSKARQVTEPPGGQSPPTVEDVEIDEPSKVLEAKPDPAKPGVERPESERSVFKDPQISAITAAAREPQSPVALAPEARVTMASIPHVLVRMASDADQKTQSVKLRLDPPRLGEIFVDLKLGENGLSLRIVSQSPEVRDLLQQDLPRLQELLKASGLNLQLFSASCDLAGERSDRQSPARPERPSPPSSSSAQEPDTRVAVLRRQYDTSMRINAHA